MAAGFGGVGVCLFTEGDEIIAEFFDASDGEPRVLASIKQGEEFAELIADIALGFRVRGACEPCSICSPARVLDLEACVLVCGCLGDE